MPPLSSHSTISVPGVWTWLESRDTHLTQGKESREGNAEQL